jgi:hypothetical protein
MRGETQAGMPVLLVRNDREKLALNQYAAGKVGLVEGVARGTGTGIRKHAQPLRIHVFSIFQILQPDGQFENVLGRPGRGLNDAHNVCEHVGALLLDAGRELPRLGVFPRNASCHHKRPNLAGVGDRMRVVEAFDFDTAAFRQGLTPGRRIVDSIIAASGKICVTGVLPLTA